MQAVPRWRLPTPTPLSMRSIRSVLRPLVIAAAALTLTQGVLAAQALPTPQALAARHDSLVGARVVLEAHQSVRMVGSMQIEAVGIDAPLEILKRRPNQYLMRATLGPMGEMLTGYDGRNAWAVQPGAGATLITGDAATPIAEQANYFGDLHQYEKFSSTETLAETEFDGKRVHPVRLIRAGTDTLYEFFEVASGLSVGSRSAVSTPMGRMETTSVVGEYRDFGGLKVATRIEQRLPQYSLVIRIREVEFDTVDEAAVAPPESVRALIKP